MNMMKSILFLTFFAAGIVAIANNNTISTKDSEADKHPTPQQRHQDYYADIEQKINQHYGMSNIHFDVQEVMTITLDEARMGQTVWHNMHQMVLSDGFIALNIPGMKSNNSNEDIIVFTKWETNHSEFRIMMYDQSEDPLVLFSVYGVMKSKIID